MYLGNKTRHAKSFLYHVPFCLRRISLVLCLYFFGDYSNSICLLGVIVSQIFYFAYLANSMPHTESHFNKIEIVNELLNTLITYMIFGFAVPDESLLKSDAQEKLVILVVAIIALMCVINLGLMLAIAYKRIKHWYIERKIKNTTKKFKKIK